MGSLFQKDASAKKDAQKIPFWVLVGAAVLGLVLIVFGGGAKAQKSEEVTEQTNTEYTQAAYQAYLEERIRLLCQSVGGVGEVTAIVTLGGSFEEIYATEQRESVEEYVILGSGSTAHGMLLSRSAPEILGIGVVCREPISPALKSELIRLLSTAFDTPSNRIYVCTG